MDSSSEVRFGSLLREARLRKGLSQVELGGTKYSGSYISHLESGRRTATPEVIDFLSHRLGVSLLEWGLAPPPNTLFVGSTIEDLLVAERARSEHDWTAAREHAAQAAELAASQGDSGRHWEALYVIAQAEFSSGNFVEAARLAEELSIHDIAQQFAVARAQALSLVSVASRASDRLGWAVAFGARAVEAATSAPPIILAEALMSLVSAMSEAGHTFDENRPNLDRLKELSPKLTSDHSRGMIAWTLGTANFYAGEIEEGLKAHGAAKDLLDPRRDLRLWLRYNCAAALWRLNSGITDGVPELLQTASLGLQILGNAHDMVELRKVEALFALRTDRPAEALDLMTGVLGDPILGGNEISLGGVKLILGHAKEALGEDAEAHDCFAEAALQLEKEGRFRAALDAWRLSAGYVTSPANRLRVIS